MDEGPGGYIVALLAIVVFAGLMLGLAYFFLTVPVE